VDAYPACACCCIHVRTKSVVRNVKILVGKGLSKDGLAPSAITVGEVTSLTHEARNDAMKRASLVSKALFTGTERLEVA